MLHAHHATHADALVATLGTLLADAPPGDPFAPELVSVPTRGVERWLTQTLSAHLGATTQDGIVANIDFPSPRELVTQAIGEATGIDPDDDPWRRERTVWPLLQLVDEHLHEPWLRTLADHLKDSGVEEEQPRRLVAVRHLAQLFDRYALHRPRMLTRWADGEDVDGRGGQLAPHLAWQAELWRRLAARIDAPDPATRLRIAAERIEHGADSTLPHRLSLFGLTRLPQAHLQILRALARTREVHLFLLHPSPALWQAGGDTIPTNRLLASWGRDARELQTVLGDEIEDHPTHEEHPPPRTLLQQLQHDVRHDRAPTPTPQAHTATDEDTSVRVHSCHGRARQVEVLKDQILHALAEDPTLEPRDVIVMCPDIEAFAPLIHATFGGGSSDDPETENDPTRLQVRLADRALRQTNPVLGTLGRLLELVDRRLTATEVLDLADREPVRRRFRFTDDDLTRLTDWTQQTGVRWGLDAPHRAPFKLQKLESNTWRTGLDRVLLGVTMTEDEQPLVHDTLPLDDVESGAIDLAGRFAELVDRLHSVITTLQQPHTLTAYTEHLRHAADLLTDTTPRDAWQRDAADRLLATIAADAAGSTAPLHVAELRDLLDEHLRGRPTRANFRTGALTFCTLQPMRSIPHRVVCLLGLDDTVFPRKAPRDGDDLIVQDHQPGDHDGRSEDRQMLLDALLAAGDRLIITYTGNDERTNAQKPPAVPVAELLDVIARTAPDARPVVEHPLQPFDPRNFQTRDGATPLSFDTTTLQGARALTGTRTQRPPFLTDRLPAPTSAIVELDDLIRFVEHPARAFLRQRLGVRLTENDDEVQDALPVDLDGLQQWAIGDRMLRARLQGRSAQETRAAELARGALPPGHLADPILRPIERKVGAVYAAAREQLGDPRPPATSLDARITLADGRVLSGTVPYLHGDQLQVVLYSRVGPKHRLANWVRLLVLTVAHPDRHLDAIVIGRARSGVRRADATIARLPEIAYDDARTHLHDLVDLYDRGRREPPPLATATSHAHAEAAAHGRNADHAASKAWESDFKFPKEDAEPEHRLLLGGVLSFAELLERRPEFPTWAQRLWAPLLDHEQVQDR